MYMVRRFQIEAIVDVSAHGAIEIFLHIAIGDGRASRQAPRNLFGAGGKLVRFADPVGQSKPKCLLCAYPFGQIVKFARLRRSDQLREEVRAAVVAGEADAGERRGQNRGARHDPKITSERPSEAGTGGSARQGRQGGLGHFEQPSGRRALIDALAVNRLIDRHWRLLALGHALDVATGTEPLAGTGEDYALDRRFQFGPGQLLRQRSIHRLAHGVARLRSIERQREHALIQGGEQVESAGIDPISHKRCPAWLSE